MLNKRLCEYLGFLKVVKKPIPAYAIQLVEDDRELLKFEERLDFENRTISTLEGVFHFDYGDYLIVGNENEIWTIKESIFNKTYNLIEKPLVQEEVLGEGERRKETKERSMTREDVLEYFRDKSWDYENNEREIFPVVKLIDVLSWVEKMK